MAFKKDTITSTPAIENYKIRQEITKDNSVTKIKVDLSKQFDTCVIVFVSDWHMGTVDFDLDGAIEVMNYVLQTPNAQLFCLGDMLNTAILDSVSDMFEDIAYPQEQWQLLVDLFKQVAEQDKLAVLHLGNHERRVSKRTGFDVGKQAGTSLKKEDRYAPFYAETYVRIKCTSEPCGYYDIPIMTHHGDGGNPENHTSMNNKSLINAMGHTHNPQVWVKTLVNYDSDSKTHYKKDELEVVLPAAGGGMYGSAMGMSKIYKSPYFAVEVTTALNPKYLSSLNKDVKEPKTIISSRSINIKKKTDSKLKAKCIKTVNKVIETNKENAKIRLLGKIYDIMDILNEYGDNVCAEAKQAIAKVITTTAVKKTQQVGPLVPVEEDEYQK